MRNSGLDLLSRRSVSLLPVADLRAAPSTRALARSASIPRTPKTPRTPRILSMDFDLSPEEISFEKEVVAFLEANHSDEVMDPNPEHLSQTVETPAKRAFMAQAGRAGMAGDVLAQGIRRPGTFGDLRLLAHRGARALSAAPATGQGRRHRRQDDHPQRQRRTQRRISCPRIIRGEIEFAIGYSEPQAGSDAASMQLKAIRDEAGRGWVLVWAQDLDDLGAFRGLVLGRRADGRAQAQGHHALSDSDGSRGLRNSSDLHDRGRADERSLLQRRLRARLSRRR